MTQEDYKELNEYLNDIFVKLENQDKFYLHNLKWYSILINKYRAICESNLKQKKIIKDKSYISEYYQTYFYENNKNINLTFNDIYLLGRKIIESINLEYLKYYDEMLNNGILDFDYENLYFESYFAYYYLKDKNEINIKREFTYNDVSTLVHEFMHYMALRNSKKRLNTTNNLTEFISIYFEQYSNRYLIDLGVDQSKIDLLKRFELTYKKAYRYILYDLILISYQEFGLINENTIELINKYIRIISKEEFDDMCLKILNEARKIKIQNNQLNVANKKFIREFIDIIQCDFIYPLSTVFAMYALKNSSVDKMIWLCENVNQGMYNEFELLDKIGINIEEITIDELLNPINEFLTKQKTKVKK